MNHLPPLEHSQTVKLCPLYGHLLSMQYSSIGIYLLELPEALDVDLERELSALVLFLLLVFRSEVLLLLVFFDDVSLLLFIYDTPFVIVSSSIYEIIKNMQ